MRKLSLYGLIIGFAIATVVSTSGCAKKTIVVVKNTQNTSVMPEFGTNENITIDWDQVKEDCKDALNQDDYPHGSYLDFAVHEEEKTIELIWPMTNDSNQEEAIDYGEAYIKAFNDAAAIQDFSIAKSTDDYYGGLWDTYRINLQVYAEKNIMNSENYYVNQIIDKGTDDAVLPQIMDIATSASDESATDKASTVKESSSKDKAQVDKTTEETTVKQ